MRWKADVDQADGFVGVGAGQAAAGTGKAGDGDTEGSSGSVANAFGELACDRVADRAGLFDELGGNVGEVGLELGDVDDCAAEEATRAIGDGGDALGEQARRCRIRPWPG